MLFEDKRGIGGELLPGQTLKPTNSVFPAATGSDAPAWIAFDKQVCRNPYIFFLMNSYNMTEYNNEIPLVRYFRRLFCACKKSS